MTCRECLEQFPALSADDVSASSALTMRDHLESCPQCQQEWRVFEHTLFVLSTSLQPLPAPQASDAMWQHCSEHVFQKIEKQRLAHRSHRPGVVGWLTRQPRWGWATLGGELAVLGSVWFFTPHDTQPDALLPRRVSIPVTRVTFERPPAVASGLVNHHSALNADPFTDHVGSTLVSYSATTP